MDREELLKIHKGLTKKQKEVLVNLDQLGPLYVSFKEPVIRTFESLRKKGLIEITKQYNGLGIDYAIIKFDC